MGRELEFPHASSLPGSRSNGILPPQQLGVGSVEHRLRVTQVRSAIGEKPKTRGTLRALGLRRIGHHNEIVDSPVLQGMLRNVAHLVKVDLVPELDPSLSDLPELVGMDERGNAIARFSTSMSLAQADVALLTTLDASVRRTVVAWDSGLGRYRLDTRNVSLSGRSRPNPSYETNIIRFDAAGISASVEPANERDSDVTIIAVHATSENVGLAARIALSVKREDVAQTIVDLSR